MEGHLILSKGEIGRHTGYVGWTYFPFHKLSVLGELLTGKACNKDLAVEQYFGDQHFSQVLSRVFMLSEQQEWCGYSQ